MFENKICYFFNFFPSSNKKEFYILSNKKNSREIVFEKGNSEAIEFMAPKFKGFKKKIIYFMIKGKILLPFLKKVSLDPKIGQLIFVGGQIKVFDFKGKKVLSFPLHKGEAPFFIKSKKDQKEMAKRKIAPKVFSLVEEIPFSEEELLNVPTKANKEKVIKLLLENYNRGGIKKIPIKEHLEKTFSILGDEKKMKKSLQKAINFLSKKEISILNAPLHGDFAIEQVLIKNKQLLLTDWNIREGPIVGDLVNLFRFQKNLLGEKEFLKLLSFYPEEVKKNIKEYIILNEIDLLILYPRRKNIFDDRIKYLLSKSH